MTRITADHDATVTRQPSPAPHGKGPVMTDERYERVLHALNTHPDLQGENIRLPAAGKGVGGFLGIAGLLLLALTALGAFIHTPAHALAAFEVGVFTVLACCLGALFFVMVFHATNTYWATTIRRQLENIAGLVWAPLLGLVGVIIIELISSAATGHGVLFQWLDEAERGTYLLLHKGGYLNLAFLLFRFVIYGAVWLFLARSLLSMSREQDATGDRMLTVMMRRRSTWGLLVFTLTVAFAAFDFLMSLDYRFYSTMWPVYFFAGAAMSGLALVAVILSSLRLTGRLTGVVTDEHYHDLGKLMFAFGACFWGYIAFSQYFLIWYGNIPEETKYFLFRKTGGWEYVSITLVVGHFIVPFLLLISRKLKRNVLGLGLMGVYMLLLQVIDMVWVIRPMAYAEASPPGPTSWWLDVVAVAGVLAIFAALVVGAVTSGPLTPIKDPKLLKSLEHKNYV